MPTWLSNKTLVIAKTANGFAVEGALGSDVTQILVFATWADLNYYLDNNWASVASP